MFFLSAVFLPPSKTKFPHSASKQRVFSFNIWLEKRPAQPVAALPKAGWRVFTILPLMGGSVCPGAISDLRQQALKALHRLSSPLPRIRLPPFCILAASQRCVSATVGRCPPPHPIPPPQGWSRASPNRFRLWEVTSRFNK